MKKKTEQQNQDGEKIVFPVEWIGNRVPATITTPGGKELTPQYMRDGFILFTDTTTGSYVRTVDDDETHERCILLEYDDQ